MPARNNSDPGQTPGTSSRQCLRKLSHQFIKFRLTFDLLAGCKATSSFRRPETSVSLKVGHLFPLVDVNLPEYKHSATLRRLPYVDVLNWTGITLLIILDGSESLYLRVASKVKRTQSFSLCTAGT